MDEQNLYNGDPWDSGAYGTGRTNPPKKHSGLVAVLLVLVIFLSGIITVLGLLNVRLFRELNIQEEPDQEDALSISFSQEKQDSPETEPLPNRQTFCQDTTIDLKTSPKSVSTMPEEGGISLQEIYEKNIPSVVSIRTQFPGGGATGTGVVVSSEGYIVTNSHVVQNAVAISVQLTDNRVLTANLVGQDDISDLAVLYIEADNLQAAEFGNSDSVIVCDSFWEIVLPPSAILWELI